MPLWVRCGLLLVVCSSFTAAYITDEQPANQTEPPAQVTAADAWPILKAGLTAHGFNKRAAAVSALALLPDDSQATQLAQKALTDQNPEVRKAAATALGQMRARTAIPGLQTALKDKDLGVGLAAAASLKLLDDTAAYDFYYELLLGKRKSKESLLAEQQKRLHDPKELAQLGFSEGLGFVPFGSLGYTAVKILLKDKSSAVRAAAAKALARDPDPRSAEALKETASDKHWVVRAAALNAIAERGDPALLPVAVEDMTDEKDAVRFTAAATAIRLSSIHQKRTEKK
jgi:HEAT repeat protein